MAYDFTNIFQKINEIDILIKADWTGDENLYAKLALIKPLCENHLKNVYANFLTQNDVTQLQNQLTNLESYTKGYKTGQTGNSTHIINTINTILPIITKIPAVGKGETSSVLTKIIDDFNQKNARIIAEITQEKEVLAKEVTDLSKIITMLSKKIEDEENKVLSISTAFQEQFSVAQEKRGVDFATVQKERGETFENQEKEREEIFEDREKERDKKFQAQSDSLSSSANMTLSKIDEIKIQVEEIYGAIGKTSIVGAQKTYANNAKVMAHTLQGASIVFMIIAVSVLISLLSGFFEKPETLGWLPFIFRLSIGAILLLPAIYLANEGKKQREKENRYRELEIKMTAITPYFLEISDGASKDNENLPEKDRVKLELAQKLLTPCEPAPDSHVVLPPEIVDIIKAALKK
ncbi:MAG: hypothetical protein LBU87_02095 [Lactobacillales bacterium]|jgi:hypothetical protein|nr:hypothetical protein [Lactobacillales bacterium]